MIGTVDVMPGGPRVVSRRSGPPAPIARPPAVSNTRLAMVVVVTGETMLFAGLVGMFLVFRLAAAEWPPADLPRLPLGLTAANSVLLFASALPMHWALRAIRADRPDDATRSLGWTAAAGTLFLLIQGGEWVRLVEHGLTLGSSVYGAAFYLLIGCHALHVLTAVVWLVAVAMLTARGRYTSEAYAGVEMCAIYWYFVCALWAGLFPLVYLW